MKLHYPTLYKDNRKKVAMMFLSLLLLLFAMPSTSFAYSPPTPEPEPEPEPVVEEEILTPMQDPLTPEGNLTLVDDIFTNNEGDKQFITAISKNGNWFYLVIDRAGDNNNVYLLNMVDEADLISLMSGEDVTLGYLMEEETEEPEPLPEPEPEPEPVEEEVVTEQDSSLMPLIGLGLLGGGAAFYFLKVKPSQVPQGNPLLDDLDDDEDEEEEQDD